MTRLTAGSPLELIVVIPVYNEAECIAEVLSRWQEVLAGLSIRYRLDVYNDGSRDSTAEALEVFDGDPSIRVVHQENAGHGPTILRGYRQAVTEAPWVFQVDSDGEISASEFPALWRQHANYDFLIGQRQQRTGPIDRKLITSVSRLAVRALFGPGITDVNCPFRLMRGSFLEPLLVDIPDDVFAPNVMLSGLAVARSGRVYQHPVTFTPRQTGTVSIAGTRLWKSAIRAFRQTCQAARSRSNPGQKAAKQSKHDASNSCDVATTQGFDQAPRSPAQKIDYLIVGSGLYGSVMAERLRSAGKSVLVVEKRDHIGGNCATEVDPTTQIPIHKYGTHIFHTNNQRIWDYIRQFGQFNDYQHRVVARHNGCDYPMPINVDTINRFFGTQLIPVEVPTFLKSHCRQIECPRNFEEKALSMIGPELYDAFIRGYTEKQWGRDPSQLPSSIFSRLPIRASQDDRYFDDRFQGVPIEGYSPLFARMLDQIPVELDNDFLAHREDWQSRCRNMIYTGPIDAYFGYRYGRLNWRSVRFERELIHQADYQGTSVVNYVDREVPYTRIHEPQHLHPERNNRSGQTIIQREYPQLNHQAPYYPVRAPEDMTKLEQYQDLVKHEPSVHFGGRLAEYKYYDMHQVIGAALHSADKLLGVTRVQHAA